MLKLYHDWDSIQSIKVRFCLYEKALEFSGRIVSIKTFENLRPAYLALNPNGLVPTIDHDGRVIIESSIINEYLDDIGTAPRLMLDAPWERALVRMWSRYEDDVMHPAVRPATFQLMIKQRYLAMSKDEMEALMRSHPMPQRAAAYRDWATGTIDFDAVVQSTVKLREILARIDAALEGGAWLVGGRFTLADIAAVAFMDRVETFGMAFLWDKQPRVAEWYKRLKARPAFAAALPSAEGRLPAPTAEALLEVRRRLAA